MQGNAVDWNTVGLVDRLTKLYNDGGYDCRSIATLLSSEFGLPINKNAVIGKAHRLELPPMPKPVKAKRSRRPTPKRIKPPTYISDLSPRNYMPPPANGISIYDLNNCTCRYPLGAGPPFLFCGQFCQDDCSYCPHHCEMAHKQ